MGQRITGVYKLVTLPSIYRAIQDVLGSDRSRTRFVEEVLQPADGAKVLDVGCGPAALFEFLPNVAYTGVDLNPNHIDDAKRRYGDRGRFIAGDVATALPDDEEGTFDLVVASALLHHLDDQQSRKLLADLCRLVKPGGRVVTLDNVWLERQNPIAVLLNKLDSGLNVRDAEGYLKLTERLNFSVKSRIFRDLMRIPYDHFCMDLARRDDGDL